MIKISKRELEFLLQAQKMFEAHPYLSTWRGDGSLDEIIALRTGSDRQHIEIYRLDPVAKFTHTLSMAPDLVLDEPKNEDTDIEEEFTF